MTTNQTPGTNELFTTTEYFYLKVANSNWGKVAKLNIERKPGIKQAASEKCYWAGDPPNGLGVSPSRAPFQECTIFYIEEVIPQTWTGASFALRE